MNCKKIKELIQLDYMDTETSAAVTEQIRGHLRSCADCRAFEHMIKETVSEPFRRAPLVEPPERVWCAIKEAIELEHHRAVEMFPSRVVRWVKAHLLINTPAFALSTAVTFALMVLFYSQLPFHKQHAVKDYLREQSQFLSSLQDPVNGDFERETSVGTPIERFLF